MLPLLFLTDLKYTTGASSVRDEPSGCVIPVLEVRSRRCVGPRSSGLHLPGVGHLTREGAVASPCLQPQVLDLSAPAPRSSRRAEVTSWCSWPETQPCSMLGGCGRGKGKALLHCQLAEPPQCICFLPQPSRLNQLEVFLPVIEGD